MSSKRPTEEFPAAVLPLSLRRWYGVEGKAETLRELLKEPLIREAIATLMEMSRPTQAVTKNPMESNATMLGWYAGYCDALSDLQGKLTDPSMPDKLRASAQRRASQGDDPLDPWAHIDKPSDDYAFGDTVTVTPLDD